MGYMGDWHTVPMTRLEFTMMMIVVLLTAVVVGAICIEATTGLPARTAIERALTRP